jgi:hypothetical protein
MLLAITRNVNSLQKGLVMIDPKIFASFAQAIKDKRDAEAKLNAAKRTIAELQEPIQAAFLELESQQIHVHGETIYLDTRIFVSASQGEERLNEVLRAHHLDLLIKEQANKNTLAAWVREQRKRNMPIPDDLLAVMTITEKREAHAQASERSHKMPVNGQSLEEAEASSGLAGEAPVQMPDESDVPVGE